MAFTVYLDPQERDFTVYVPLVSSMSKLFGIIAG
jgi:hypothetical protein